MIAKIVEKAPRMKSREAGFRIYDQYNMEYKDYTKEDLLEAINNGLVVENLRIGTGAKVIQFIGYPTSTSVYPTVNMETSTKDNWVLVRYIPNSTYFCVDRNGVVHTLTYENFLRKVKECRICNLYRDLSKYYDM
jgi:hypothetical protein